MEEIKTSAKLQFFSGFYNSIWDSDSAIEDYAYCEEKEYGKDFDIDEEAYEKAVSESVTNIYADWVAEHISKNIKIEFEGITSPKQYNYSTDSIDVIITVDEQGKNDILDKIAQNKDVIGGWIASDFKPCSGWIPFLEDDIEDWNENALFNTSELRQPAYLSVMLDYIIKAEWKKKKWSLDMDYAAYEFCEVMADDFIFDKSEEETEE